MRARPFADSVRTERTLGAVRLIVVLALVVHVIAVRDDLRAADMLVAALVGIGALVTTATVSIVTALRATTSRPLQVSGVATMLVDAAAVGLVAWSLLTAQPEQTLAWVFVLWIPAGAALRFRTRGAAVSTVVATAVVAAVTAGRDARLDIDTATWATTGLPFLLVLLVGGVVGVSSLCQRRSAVSMNAELAAERDRASALREADDLKNTFLAAVSHEMRTPLTSILGFAVTLLDRHDIRPEVRENMLRTMVEEAEHLEDILANMLDLDRLTRGRTTLVPVRVDASRLVAGAVDHVAKRSGREVTCQLADDVQLYLDAAKVERIVENLVGNAVKYTPADAEIIVAVRRERCGVLIRVDDGGPGIAPELRESIFQPFQRGEDVGVPGTGIGLSLVDRFARMHGGRAWVDAAPSGGARFQVFLNELEPEAREALPPSTSKRAATRRADDESGGAAPRMTGGGPQMILSQPDA